MDMRKSRKFEIDDEPKAGSEFRFTLPAGLGRLQATCSIDGNVVATRDCSEPPCYEALYLSDGLANSYLKIEVRGEGVRMMYENAILSPEGHSAIEVAEAELSDSQDVAEPLDSADESETST